MVTVTAAIWRWRQGGPNLPIIYAVDDETFVRVFRTVSYNEIRTEAMRFSGVTKTGAYATALAEIYERGVNGPLEKTA